MSPRPYAYILENNLFAVPPYACILSSDQYHPASPSTLPAGNKKHDATHLRKTRTRKQFDLDHSGSIDAQELRQAIGFMAPGLPVRIRGLARGLY